MTVLERGDRYPTGNTLTLTQRVVKRAMLRHQLRTIVAGWLLAGLELRGVGVEELATQAGITRETIWKLRTERGDATDDTLIALARALKIPLPILTVQDEKGAADYVAGVRATVKQIRRTLDELEARPPSAASDDGPRAAQIEEQIGPVRKARPKKQAPRRSG